MAIEVSDIKIKKDGAWHSLKNGYVYKDGKKQILPGAAAVRGNGNWYKIKDEETQQEYHFGITYSEADVDLFVSCVFLEGWTLMGQFHVEIEFTFDVISNPIQVNITVPAGQTEASVVVPNILLHGGSVHHLNVTSYTPTVTQNGSLVVVR
ncbi:MAG: hypothetical protein LBQ28_09125 [Prevotellaceae bacterium]|jgi:hypothetical protein|nr:hypothetical protein [Prevotellaceae bacterium]